MGVTLGAEVGYAVRFENVSTPGTTRVRFCTDGVLLRELMEDPLLSRYSVVMVDEAHERSLATDLLLGLLKKVQRRRPDLRIIIASATIQAEEFAAFFDTRHLAPKPAAGEVASSNAPSREPGIVSVEGRAHTVLIHYLEKPAPDYVRASVEAAIDIHRAEGPGDVLVFLTGEEEIEAAVSMLQEEAEDNSQRLPGGRTRAVHRTPALRGAIPGAADGGVQARAEVHSQNRRGE
jgi:ATP-dependent RNA helicase DDX35